MAKHRGPSDIVLQVQLLRYCIVGGIGTGLHIGTAVFLVELPKASPVFASLMGFVVALVASYALNRLWVFGRAAGLWTALGRYTLVCLSGLALNAAIMTITTGWLGWYYLWGLAIVVAVVPLTNFTLNRAWSFAGAAAHSRSP